MADDGGEGVHRFGGFDVVEGHHIRNDRIAIGQRVIFVVDIDAASGRAEAAGGECEDIEIRVLRIGHEDEIFDRRGLAQELGGFVEGERVLWACFLDEGKFRIGGGLGNDHPTAGVFAVESGERVAAEFRFDDVFGDCVFAEGDAGLRVGRAGGLRGIGGRFAGIGWLGWHCGIRAWRQALAAAHGDRWGCLRGLVGFRSGRRHGFLREGREARGKDQGDDADEGHKRGTVERDHFSGGD